MSLRGRYTRRIARFLRLVLFFPPLRATVQPLRLLKVTIEHQPPGLVWTTGSCFWTTWTATQTSPTQSRGHTSGLTGASTKPGQDSSTGVRRKVLTLSGACGSRDQYCPPTGSVQGFYSTDDMLGSTLTDQWPSFSFYDDEFGLTGKVHSVVPGLGDAFELTQRECSSNVGNNARHTRANIMVLARSHVLACSRSQELLFRLDPSLLARTC
jgi:hypothetical protein